LRGKAKSGGTPSEWGARDLPGRRSSLQRWQYRQYAFLVGSYSGEPLQALELMHQPVFHLS